MSERVARARVLQGVAEFTEAQLAPALRAAHDSLFRWAMARKLLHGRGAAAPARMARNASRARAGADAGARREWRTLKCPQAPFAHSEQACRCPLRMRPH